VTLETVTDDNIDIILRRQIEEFKKEIKRQKGLILVLMTRQAGSLEFQKEL
jgi:hypothetical protein